jgi:DNA-binding response OmpR family regulator
MPYAANPIQREKPMRSFEEIRDKKILLIDDDETIRDSLKMFFSGEGIHIDTAETAEEGIHALEKQSYDIIVTDYKLPGMDGLTFLRHICDLCPDAFKILMTAYGSNELLAAASETGVDEYLEKPFNARIFRRSLKRFVGKRR